MKNPQNISWNDTTSYEDGSPFGASDFMAYELGAASSETAEPVALLALPTSLGVGTSPIPDVVKQTRGRQWVALRTLDNYGQISDWSNKVEVHYTGRPLPPSSTTPS